METAQLIVVLSLSVAVLWGLADFWAARASKITGPVTTALGVNAVSLLFMVLLYVAVPQHPAQASGQGIAWAMAGGAIISVAMILLYKGFAHGPVSLVSPIGSAYPVVMTLLALTIFHGRLSSGQLLAIAAIVLGIMAAAGLFTVRRSERHMSKGPTLAVASAIVYGVGFTCMAQASIHIGWELASLLQCVGGTAIFAILLPLARGAEAPLRGLWRTLTNGFVAGAAITGIAAMCALNLAFSKDPSAGAIAGAISACYPVITVLLALKHFKEEPKPIPLAGATLAVAGVVALSLIS
ncbi:MAG TPA: DMT family transporter [Ktedonobacteraceae bacterium]|nr:DMT family transporter [Ktedonobacteraceae bacterium]